MHNLNNLLVLLYSKHSRRLSCSQIALDNNFSAFLFKVQIPLRSYLCVSACICVSYKSKRTSITNPVGTTCFSSDQWWRPEHKRLNRKKKKNTVQPSGLFLFAISAHVSGPLKAHWPTIRLIPHLFYQPVFSAHLHLCLIYNCSSPPGSVNLGHSFAGP